MSNVSTSETGHAKITANLGRLNVIANRNNSIYKATNPLIKISAISAAVADGDKCIAAVSPVEKSYNLSVNKRRDIFITLSPTVTASFNFLGSLSGVDKSLNKSANTLMKKIKGTNRKADKADTSTAQTSTSLTSPTTTTPAPTRKKHSVSQQSHDMKIKNFREYIDVLKLIPQYDPEETEIKIATLIALVDNLKTTNEKVDADYSPYATALNQRDTILYAPETGLVAIAKMMKNYLKSLTKISATDKQEAISLEFKSPSKANLFL